MNGLLLTEKYIMIFFLVLLTKNANLTHVKLITLREE